MTRAIATAPASEQTTLLTSRGGYLRLEEKVKDFLSQALGSGVLESF